jgi:hypothetical protein
LSQTVLAPLVSPDARHVPLSQQPPPAQVFPPTQAVVPPWQLLPFATHRVLPGSQQLFAPHAFPWQQGSGAVPQAVQLPPEQTVLAAWQLLPLATHLFVPGSQQSPGEPGHVLPAQQSLPVVPQPVQLPPAEGQSSLEVQSWPGPTHTPLGSQHPAGHELPWQHGSLTPASFSPPHAVQLPEEQTVPLAWHELPLPTQVSFVSQHPLLHAPP